jgi:hypothetical protein
MKPRIGFSGLLLLALFLALAPTALASNTWYVDGVNGSDSNNCKTPQTACKTIGHAISLASSGDSIRVAPATYTENLTIKMGLSVIGSGATTTIIDGGGMGTAVGVSASAKVVLSKFTIRNGRARFGGGIANLGMLTINDSAITGNVGGGGGFRGFCFGGGVLNDGTLSINHTTVSSNNAMAGGGVCNRGTATIRNSTITGNFASANGPGYPAGGGIFSQTSAVLIINSTISGNVAQQGSLFGFGADGGGVDGTATISNSTISGNSVRGYKSGTGGGIVGGALQDSIVANNSPGNCYGTITSKGYNLSSDSTCNFNGTGDLNNTDPVLGTLGNYGGPTQTIPLRSGSPAIDAGNPAGCTDGQGHLLKTDQRGKPRHDKEDAGGCDMGAYERQKD